MNEDKDIFLMIQKREQEIAQQERERIIKLLEVTMATSPLLADLIDLIKGEQK